jgi:hypothetical protein
MTGTHTTVIARLNLVTQYATRFAIQSQPPLKYRMPRLAEHLARHCERSEAICACHSF